MGSLKSFKESIFGGGWLGKTLAPLERKLQSVKWGEYKLRDLFNHIEQGRRLKKDDQAPGTIPFVMSGTTNQGVVGYVSNPVASFPKNSLTVDIFGNTFYRSYAFGAGDDTGVYWSDRRDYSHSTMLFFVATINKALSGKYSYGHKLRSSQSLDSVILLPQTESGDIDVAFMECLVRELEESRLRELEESRLRELEKYLEVTGLSNYQLTKTDLAALRNYPSYIWKEFNVGKLFGKSTRGKRLKGDDRTPGSLVFVTAGEANTGISALVGNNVEVFSRNTTTIDMFGSAKYRNYEYGADDHVAVVHTESLRKNAAIFVTSACHKAAHTGKFDYGHNFYAKDADELNIMLPSCVDGSPDFNAMEQLIAAIHKIVIANVARYTLNKIEITRQVVDKERVLESSRKTSVPIYEKYRPGFIPLYSLRAACGHFDNNEIPEIEGWVDVSGLGFTPDKNKYFVIHAKGDSMIPKIQDGDFCVFEWYKAGSREGEIVLIQISEYDSDYDGKYTIKRYHSEKHVSESGWQHSIVELIPLNKEYQVISINPMESDNYRTIGILKAVLN